MMGRAVLLLRNLYFLHRLTSYSSKNSTKCPEIYFLVSFVGCDVTKMCIIPRFLSKDIYVEKNHRIITFGKDV